MHSLSTVSSMGRLSFISVSHRKLGPFSHRGYSQSQTNQLLWMVNLWDCPSQDSLPPCFDRRQVANLMNPIFYKLTPLLVTLLDPEQHDLRVSNVDREVRCEFTVKCKGDASQQSG